jgi:hypothetical protein
MSIEFGQQRKVFQMPLVSCRRRRNEPALSTLKRVEAPLVLRCEKKPEDGSMEGVKCLPFNYSDREMRSIPNFEKDLLDEKQKKFAQGEIPTQTGKVRIWKGGYEKRYSNTWEAELKKALEKTKLSMKDMIDHMISESEKVMYMM